MIHIGFDHALRPSDHFRRGSIFNAENEILMISQGAAPIRRRDNLFRYAVMIKVARTKNTSAAVNAVRRLASSLHVDGFRGVEINPNDIL